jgi:hypothetical protein
VVVPLPFTREDTLFARWLPACDMRSEIEVLREEDVVPDSEVVDGVADVGGGTSRPAQP